MNVVQMPKYDGGQRRPGLADLHAWLLILLAFLCFDMNGCSMSGCAVREAKEGIKDLTLPDGGKEAPILPPGKSEGATIDELKRRLALREEAEARMHAEAGVLRKQIKRERTDAQLASMRILAWWLIAVSVIACIGFVFLKVWLKGVLSGLTTAGIVTFGGLLIVCGVFLYFGPALLWIAFLCGIVVVLVMALWGGKRLIDLRRAVVATSDMAEGLLDQIADVEVVKQVKRGAAELQNARGVRQIIAQARGKDHKKPVPA